MKGVLDFIKQRMLRKVDYVRERNFLRETHVQSLMERERRQYLILGRVWVGTYSTLLSICSSMKSKTPVIL